MDQFSRDSFGNELSGGAAQERQDVRDSLFLMAGLRVAGRHGVRQVRVRNLSAGGLMAEYPEGLDMGTPIEVDVRGIGWVQGRVAWSTAGRIGVAFNQPIDPILARKPVGRGARTPDYAKPLLGRR
jgi:hypothetical protein